MNLKKLGKNWVIAACRGFKISSQKTEKYLHTHLRNTYFDISLQSLVNSKTGSTILRDIRAITNAKIITVTTITATKIPIWAPTNAPIVESKLLTGANTSLSGTTTANMYLYNSEGYHTKKTQLLYSYY